MFLSFLRTSERLSRWSTGGRAGRGVTYLHGGGQLMQIRSITTATRVCTAVVTVPLRDVLSCEQR